MKHTLLLLAAAALLAAGCSKSEMAEASAGESASYKSEAENAKPSSAPAKGELVSQIRGRDALPVAPKEVPLRNVIKNGSLAVRVESVEKAEDKVMALVSGAGGYVDSAESTDLASATPQLAMKLRVPSTHFDSVMEGLEALGMRLSKKVKTEDVTAGVVDMAARLKVMRAQEEVYRRMLAKATGSQEMIDAQSKLMELRGQIESLDAQHKALSKLASLSTIELMLQQSSESAVAATADPNWAKESWGGALSTMGNLARVIGAGLIWLAVFAPIWLPALLLARAIWRKGQPNPGPKFDVSA